MKEESVSMLMKQPLLLMERSPNIEKNIHKKIGPLITSIALESLPPVPLYLPPIGAKLLGRSRVQ